MGEVREGQVSRVLEHDLQLREACHRADLHLRLGFVWPGETAQDCNLLAARL